MQKLRNWISTHWAGQTEFIWLILINLLGVRLGLHLLGISLGPAPDLIWNGFFILVAGVFIWQLVGTIRHGLAGLDHADGLFVIFALFGAMLVVVVTTTWQIGDQYRLMHAPDPEPYQDPSIITLPASDDGTTIFLNGPITLKMYNAFRDLKDYENLRSVTLNSEGGNIFAARGFYRLILERELNTHVTGSCFSACTLIFISGAKRTAETDAQFGFHSYAYALTSSGRSIDVTKEQERDRKLFTNRGVPSGFVDQIFNTPADQLWRPDLGVLRAAKILN